MQFIALRQRQAIVVSRDRQAASRLAAKTFLIMRLTAILLIAILMNVHASGVSQTVTFTGKNVALQEVFSVVKRQTKYVFIYNKDVLASANHVTITARDMPLDEFLQTIFKEQQVTYSIIGNTIVVKPLPSSVSSGNDEKFPTGNRPDIIPPVTVKGRVLNKKGEPLPGASIDVKGARHTIITDQLGNFVLDNLTADNVLVISFIGYKSQTIKVGKNTELTITLAVSESELDKVVIQGYGTTSARLRTGNIATITAEDIEKQPVANVLQALQNLVPGVSVVQTNGFSSAPYRVEIRGRNNLPATATENNLSDPLYIIDGVPITAGNGDPNNRGINQNGNLGPAGGQSPLFSINPADIETISVLKDADATAIYGARAANGVILITTKRGTPGKTFFSIGGYTGVSMQMKKLNLMNTQQYLAMRRQAMANDKKALTTSNAYEMLVFDTTRYTDWQDELLKSATTSDAQMSLSGGSDATTFRLTTSYHNETPPFPGSYQDRRLTGMLTLNHRTLNKRLNIAMQVNFGNTFSNLPSYDPSSLIFLPPNGPDIKMANGSPNYAGWRPASYPFTAFFNPYKATTDNLVTNLGLNFTIVKGLVLSANVGYNLFSQNQLTLNPAASQNPLYSQRGQPYFGNNRGRTWLIEPNLAYAFRKGRSQLQTMVGGTMQSSEMQGSFINGNGYTVDALLEDISAAATVVGTTNNSKTNFQSLYGRVTYNYFNKYILNVNVRRDGSSRFGPDKQYGNFGSVGAAWIFTDENIIKDNLPWLSFGKLRGSYGITGGDGLGDYQYLESMKTPFGNYQGAPVLTLSRAANPDFSWASTKKLEIATEWGLWDNDVMFTVAWFKNLTSNQLVANPLPDLTGFPTVVTNLPATVRNTGWEFTVQTKNIKSNSWTWNTALNIGILRNKLLAFPDLEHSSYSQYYKVGESISRIGLFHYQGLDPATGKYMIEDKDKDNYLGYPLDYDFYNTIPDFTGSLINTIHYKQISLSFMFSFAKQKGFANAYNSTPGNTGTNQVVDNTPRWAKPGDTGPLAWYTTGGGSSFGNYLKSDAMWTDASYIRMQNLSLSYNLPKRWISKIKMSDLRIYAQGQNIFTLSGYKGTDPAAPNIGTKLPPRKILTAGIQLTF